MAYPERVKELLLTAEDYLSPEQKEVISRFEDRCVELRQQYSQDSQLFFQETGKSFAKFAVDEIAGVQEALRYHDWILDGLLLSGKF